MDIVSRHLNGGELRLLEQVGHRGNSLTLRSGKAIEAVANAVETMRHNLNQDLRFLFTTNALIGKERDFPLLCGFRTLEAWQHLATDPASEQSDEIIAGVRRVLASAKRPSKLPSQTWKLFRSWLESATGLVVSYREHWKLMSDPVKRC